MTFAVKIWNTFQGLKFSGTVPDLRRAAFGWEKKNPILQKNSVDITFESMSSPTNGMRGAQLSLSIKLALLANQIFLLLMR